MRMKKLLFVVILSSIFLFAGCSKERCLEGKVLEIQSNEDVGVVAFTIKPDGNPETRILLTDETSIVSWMRQYEGRNDEYNSRLSQKELENTCASVWFSGPKRTFTKENGEKIPAYNATSIQIIGGDSRERVSLRDGTEVEIWIEDYGRTKVYKLEGGAELLKEERLSDLSNDIVSGQARFDALKEEVQTRILTYIETHVDLYDVSEELEKAYAAYQKKEETEVFDVPYLYQSIHLVASNDRMVYFDVSQRGSEQGESTKNFDMSMAFDCETGEPVEMWDLFRCTKEELVQTILKCSEISDPVLEEKMLAELRPEYILLLPETLEVSFPNGTLQSKEEEEKNYNTFSIDWSEKGIQEIVYEWAIPKEIHQVWLGDN